MKVTVSKGSKTVELELPADATVSQLKAAFKAKTGLATNRQSFRVDGPKGSDGKPSSVRYSDDKATLASYGYAPGTTLVYKDLGTQIGYRTVFLIEYAGPIVIVLLYALRPSLLFGEGAAARGWSPLAKLAVGCWLLHFAKREFETVFVHRFSRPTMPINNLFKNCWYYWGFASAIGYYLAHPDFQGPKSELQVKAGLAVFLLAELANLTTHVQLRLLRPAEGSRERPIPSGFGFDLVACPNYLFEGLSWVGFSVMTGMVVSWVFTVVGFAQMLDWALKKDQAYRKQYGDAYKKLRRKALVPFVI